MPAFRFFWIAFPNVRFYVGLRDPTDRNRIAATSPGLSCSCASVGGSASRVRSPGGRAGLRAGRLGGSWSTR
jgi:hypothetical protein